MANAMAIRRKSISHWRVDEEARTSSDHTVIRYTIANRRVATDQWIRDRPNRKKAKEESYDEAFRAALDKRKDQMSGVMNQEQPTREALEQAADAIREAHHDAMKKAVPVANYANTRSRTGMISSAHCTTRGYRRKRHAEGTE